MIHHIIWERNSIQQHRIPCYNPREVDSMYTPVITEAKRMLIAIFDEELNNPLNSHCNEMVLFTAKHAFRVEQYANTIKDAFPQLTPVEILTLRVAAIFHDIGNAWQREGHAEIGAEVIAQLFDQSEVLAESGIDKERLVRVIRGHSDKQNMEDHDLVSVLLKDADLLDMVGAMSILMHTARYDFDDLDFYQQVLHTLEIREMNHCQREFTLLRTDKAKEMMAEKIQFIQSFILQLKHELIGETDYQEYFKGRI